MWIFNTLRVGDKLRNPIQGEFFATSAIEGPAQALIRESIQNSLDAKFGLPVRVVVTVVTKRLPSPDAVAKLFSGAWEHLGAPGNGLQTPKPDPTTPCSYLVVEDFNTTGLIGDPAQTDPEPNEKNNFFNFFRAEGLSGKTGAELGRWGVGKFVFPRSSRASTHIGITVREGIDCRRLMLGATTLKGHRVAGRGGLFTPDGLYGVQRDDGFVLPFEDGVEIDNVCAMFGVQRQSEPGTSVVVPFIDPDEFTFDGLLRAAVRSYFAPVLAGQLEITVRHDDREATLTRLTLESVLASNGSLAGELQPLVRLAKVSSAILDQDRITLNIPDPARAARWNSSLVSAEALERLRLGLDAGETVAIRVPITVRNKASGDLTSYFDIYLQPDRTCNERPVFVRDGVIVSDVRGRRASGIRSLVMVQDAPLAGMLGNSENPAHTQWQKDGSKFKGLYTYGPAVIAFVTDSVGELLAIVNQASQKPDASLTVDFFSIDAVDDAENIEDSVAHQQQPKPGEDGGESDVTITPRPTRLAVQRSGGGLAVVPGTSLPPVPFLFELWCAYEIRSGNPLKKWHPADFTLGKTGLPIKLFGPVSVITAQNNRAMLRVDGPDFRVSVDGFDTNRDIYVRAAVKEVGHADTQN